MDDDLYVATADEGRYIRPSSQWHEDAFNAWIVVDNTLITAWSSSRNKTQYIFFHFGRHALPVHYYLHQ